MIIQGLWKIFIGIIDWKGIRIRRGLLGLRLKVQFWKMELCRFLRLRFRSLLLILFKGLSSLSQKYVKSLRK
jgi:hypothetical protein